MYIQEAAPCLHYVYLNISQWEETKRAKSHLMYSEHRSCTQPLARPHALLSLSLHSFKRVLLFFFPLFLSFQGPCHCQKQMPGVFCNWREDGGAGEKVKRDILCLNKEVRLTGRVSFRNSSVTLKEDQEEVPTLVWTKDGGLSGAVMATHLHTHTLTYSKCTHLAQGNTGERLLLCTSLTILCLGKKNINLPSLKGSALLSHLQPTSATIGVESPPPLTPPHSPQSFPPPPTHSLSLLPPNPHPTPPSCSFFLFFYCPFFPDKRRTCLLVSGLSYGARWTHFHVCCPQSV